MRSLLLSAAAAVAVLFIFSGYSTGISRFDDATGSPLSTRTCAGCHNGGDFGTETQLQLLDVNGEPQTSYVPGQLYTLRIAAITTTAPAAYGMQAVVLTSDNEQAGRFGAAPAGMGIRERGDISYLDHRQRLSTSQIDIEWTAPASGTGDVSVFAVMNSVNQNFGTSGDEAVAGTVTFTEAAPSAVRELAANAIRLVRVQDGFTVAADVALAHIELYSMQGQRLLHVQAEPKVTFVKTEVNTLRSPLVVRIVASDGSERSKLLY